MKRPRVRISTLMFLVVIAALVVALVLEKRRSARLLAEAEASAATERKRADIEFTRTYYDFQLRATAQVAEQAALSKPGKSNEPTSP
jgi:cell division protein FtsL